MMTPDLENLERTFTDIKQIDPAIGRKIMANYDDFIKKYKLVIKVKSVASLLEKARHYYFNANKIRELNLLFSTYCEIKANNLSNDDLKAANLTDYVTGNTLTLEGVEQRLTALGWKKIKRKFNTKMKT